MAKRGRSARLKGLAAEREFLAAVNERLGSDYKRGLGQTRDGGCDAHIAGLAIEIKRQERLRLPVWLQQARAGAGAGEMPAVAYRQNGKPWRVVIELELDQLADWIRTCQTR